MFVKSYMLLFYTWSPLRTKLSDLHDKYKQSCVSGDGGIVKMCF